jgi:flagellar protein FlgJ
MDINLLGIQHFNQAQNPFSPSLPPVGLNSGGGFEEILRRAEEANRSVETDGRTALPFSPVSGNAPIDKSSELYQLCLELETILIKNMINGMRNTIQKSDLIDTGFAGEIYEDMLYDEYSKLFARNANLGFAEMAYRDLTGRR